MTVFLEGIPAFLAVIAFLLAEVFNTWRPISLDYELISNIVMLIIAVCGFFLLGLPSKRRQSNFGCVLSNLCVSMAAVFMNINVFDHVIHCGSLWDDLYGWHLGWITIAVIQILCLTNLGKNLLDQIGGFLSWGKTKVIGIGHAAGEVVELIKQQDKGIGAIIGITTALWVVYLGVRSYFEGIHAVFSDPNTLRGSFFVWIACITIGCLLYIVPSVCRQSKAAVINANRKKVLLVVLTFAALVVSACVLPALAGAMGAILTGLAALACVIYAVIKAAAKRGGNQTAQSQPGTGAAGTNGQRQGPPSVNPLDVVIMLLAFIVIPIVVLFLVTAFSNEGSKLMEGGLSDFSAWLSFLEAALNVAGEMLSLLA